jgi:phage host-nuclease inhibitor protein Gam
MGACRPLNFFTQGRRMYLTEMDKTINEIANHVATQLNQAKQKIADGKQQIQDYVAKLPENFRQVGQEAAQNIQGKFDDLESSVDNKQNQLVDSLAQKYSENLQQLDAQLAEMKASNRTWMDAALDAVGGAIKTIVELKNLLMGVLAKAAGAIEKIILDPIAFLGNLVAGVKQGFMNFSGNIAQHLQKGLMGWLTGASAGAGITMPESFDIKGIFSLVTQVLGLVYETIRPKAVKRMGDKVVNHLESNFEMFIILKNEGITGLWQFIQDKIGDLQATVIDTIKTFVIENVIKGGVLWILSLLNPASAFVKACKAIIDIIMSKVFQRITRN